MNYDWKNMNNDKREILNPKIISSCVAGSFAGACGIFIGHPFDTLKVQLQVSREVKQKFSFKLNNILQLYRGWRPPVVMAGFLQSINFGLYEQGKVLTKSYMNYGHIGCVFWGGVYSGAITTALTTPINLIKIQQQVVCDMSVFQCAYSIINKYGILGLYHGYNITLIGDSFGRGIYFAAYEISKKYLNENIPNGYFKNDRNIQIISAAFAGSFCWGVVYPVDVIKSRLQADMNVSLGQLLQRSISSKREILSLYNGVSYAMVRSAPVAMTILPLYEYTQQSIMAIFFE